MNKKTVFFLLASASLLLSSCKWGGGNNQSGEKPETPVEPIIEEDIVITFDTCGGTKVSSIIYDGTPISAPVTEKYNFEFLGWFDNPDYTGNEIDFTAFIPTKSCTLYAKWGAVYYLYLYYGTSTDHERYTYHTGDVVDLNTLYVPEPIIVNKTSCPFLKWVKDFTYEDVEQVISINTENIYLVAQYDKSQVPPLTNLEEVDDGVYKNTAKMDTTIFNSESGIGYFSADITFQKGIGGASGLAACMTPSNTDYSFESADGGYIACVLGPTAGGLTFCHSRGDDNGAYSGIKSLSIDSLPKSWKNKFDGIDEIEDVTVNLGLLVTETSIAAYIDGEKVNYEVPVSYIERHHGTSFGIRATSVPTYYSNFLLLDEKVQVNLNIPGKDVKVDYFVGGPINFDDTIANYEGHEIIGWYYDENLTLPLDKNHPDFNSIYNLYPKYRFITKPIIRQCDGAVISCMKEGYYSYDDAIIHVEPIGTNAISKVLVDGKEISKLDSELYGDNYYKFTVTPDCVIDVLTDVSTKPTFIVNTYSINGETGEQISLGEVTLPDTFVTEVNDYLYKISAPIVEGFTPNQDYIYVTKDDSKANKQLSFYYSEVAGGSVADASTSLSGNGTESSPYLIKSPADWLYLVNNAGNESYYKLTKSLDFASYSSTVYQVGKYAAQFKGTLSTDTAVVSPFLGHLDGNNCSIRGLSHGSKTSFSAYIIGLFGYVSGNASISNLSIYGKASCANNYGRTAGLVAIANGGTFENIASFVDAAHSNKDNATNGSTGGIIGVAVLGENDVSVKNSYNYGKIYRAVNKKLSNDPLGGIIGSAISNVKQLSISNCINFGEIENTGGLGDNGEQVYGAYAGGIIGQSASGLKLVGNDCTNFGDVIAASYAGGFSGSSCKTSLTNFINFGNIKTVKATFTYGSNTYDSTGKNVGGAFGYLSPTGETLENIYNFGNIDNNAASIGGVFGSIENKTGSVNLNNINNFGNVIKTDAGTDCGGVVGYLYTVTDADGVSNFGNVNSSSGSYNGGLFGRLGAVSGSSFKNCVNSGSIESNGSATGGILGYFSNTTGLSFTITNCINHGDIKCNANIVGGLLGQMMENSSFNMSQCSNTGKIQGIDYVAGIVGSSKNKSSLISKCTNYGDIIGNTRVAGIAGYICTYQNNLDNGENINFGLLTGGAYTDELYGQVTIVEE